MMAFLRGRGDLRWLINVEGDGDVVIDRQESD